MKEYYDLMTLLSLALNTGDYSEDYIKTKIDELCIDEESWDNITVFSLENSVAGLLYEILNGYDGIPKDAFKTISSYATKVCKRNYRFLVKAVNIHKYFSKAGIRFCILKGMAAAVDYPVPDVRKAADLDILLPVQQDLKKAIKVLVKLGFHVEDEQIALHHVAMRDESRDLVEVHTMLAEPFDNAKTNIYLNKLLPDCDTRIIYKDIMGASLPVLSDGYHAYEMLMHMLQHFLREGFGVKMLCDWVVFWNKGTDDENRKLYMKLVKESKVKGFSDTITRVCIKYLGLKREKVNWMNLYDKSRSREEYEEQTESFVKDVLEAGEFGKGKEGRMVAFRGDGVFDYVREFQHQMHLNFPKAGKIPLFWPVLWVLTYIKFQKNNKQLRSVSSKEIFKSAKKRGKLVKSMNLFK